MYIIHTLVCFASATKCFIDFYLNNAANAAKGNISDDETNQFLSTYLLYHLLNRRVGSGFYLRHVRRKICRACRTEKTL